VVLARWSVGRGGGELTDSIREQKRQKRRIRSIEVHAGYTGLRKLRARYWTVPNREITFMTLPDCFRQSRPQDFSRGRQSGEFADIRRPLELNRTVLLEAHPQSQSAVAEDEQRSRKHRAHFHCRRY
jgi:hypothetical protein